VVLAYNREEYRENAKIFERLHLGIAFNAVDLLAISTIKITGNIFIANREQFRRNRELFGAEIGGISHKIPTSLPKNRARIPGASQTIS
jgi:hypothetical protein